MKWISKKEESLFPCCPHCRIVTQKIPTKSGPGLPLIVKFWAMKSKSLLWSQLLLLMTFRLQKNTMSSNKIPDLVNIPDFEPDQDDTVLDDDELSTFASGEDSLCPELAAPAVTSSE